MKMLLKLSPGKWPSFCLDVNVLLNRPQESPDPHGLGVYPNNKANTAKSMSKVYAVIQLTKDICLHLPLLNQYVPLQYVVTQI